MDIGVENSGYVMKRSLFTCAAVLFSGLAMAAQTSALVTAEGWTYLPGLANPASAGLQVLDPDGSGQQITVVASVASGVGRSSYPVLAILDSQGEGFALKHHLMLPDNVDFYGSILRFNRADHVGDLLAVSVSDRLYPYDNRRLLIFGGMPLALISETSLPSRFSISAISDVDGDGRPELVGIDTKYWFSPNPAIIDMDSGAVIWTDPAQFVTRLHVGDVGTDQRVIIVHRESSGLVLDAATRQVLWQWPDGFDDEVVFGDFLPPLGTREFAVVSRNQGSVKVFRVAPTFSPMIEFSMPQPSALLVADIDGDGYDEILAGKEGDRKIAAYQPRLSGAILIEYEDQGARVAAIDVLGSGAEPDRKLVVGTNDFGTWGRLRVLDLADGQSLYESVVERGPFHALDVGNVLGTPGPGQVVYANRGGPIYGFISVVRLDHATGALQASREVELWQANSFNDRVDVVLAQLDADPAQEVLVSASHSWRADMAAFDDGFFEPQWTSFIEGWTGSVGPIIAMDVSGDGFDDAVAMVGGALAFIDGSSGLELWRSVSLDVSGAKSLAAGPIASGGADGIAMGVGTTVYIFDVEKRAIHRVHELEAEVIGQHVEEREGQCFHVLTFSDHLQRRDCLSGLVDSERTFAEAAVFVGYPSDSFGDLVLGDGRGLVLDRDGSILLERRDIDYELGHGNRGRVHAGAGEISVVLGGVVGVHRVRFETGPLFADGFELP